jgi:hypothetical protein
MATILVGYLYKKYKNRKGGSTRLDESAGPTQSVHPQQPEHVAVASASLSSAQSRPPDRQHTKSSFKWKIILMITLLIPIFLETLDYTGGWLRFNYDHASAT